MSEQPGTGNNNKLLAALGYPIPPIALIVLLMEDKRNLPFLRFHAVQSLALSVVIFVAGIILSAVTLGFGAICTPLLWLVTFWPAYDSYNGNYTEIPILTNFLKKQDWV
jgi:uncharacterized membrane protein